MNRAGNVTPSTDSAICVPSHTIPYFPMHSPHRERNCHFNPLALLTFLSDQEFFFRIPFDSLDHLLCAWEHEVSVSDVASVSDLSEEAVKIPYKDFASKHRATAHLREIPHTLITS
jgi:hypothetical protein